jgi:hypothetical protein
MKQVTLTFQVNDDTEMSRLISEFTNFLMGGDDDPQVQDVTEKYAALLSGIHPIKGPNGVDWSDVHMIDPDEWPQEVFAIVGWLADVNGPEDLAIQLVQQMSNAEYEQLLSDIRESTDEVAAWVDYDFEGDD